jgi:hypothetical protein
MSNHIFMDEGSATIVHKGIGYPITVMDEVSATDIVGEERG